MLHLKVRFFRGLAMRRRRHREGADVIGGTHHKVNPRYASKNTLLIERMREPAEHKFLLAHETIEHLLMRLKRWSYRRAHAYATKVEHALRRGAPPARTVRTALQAQFGKHNGTQFAIGLMSGYRRI